MGLNGEEERAGGAGGGERGERCEWEEAAGHTAAARLQLFRSEREREGGRYCVRVCVSVLC